MKESLRKAQMRYLNTENIEKYIKFFKRHRPYIINGDLYFENYNHDNPVYFTINNPKNFAFLLRNKLPFRILYMYSDLSKDNLLNCSPNLKSFPTFNITF